VLASAALILGLPRIALPVCPPLCRPARDLHDPADVIDKTQFSLLITVVVLSAIVPTAIAQRFFQPETAAEEKMPSGRPLPDPT